MALSVIAIAVLLSAGSKKGKLSTGKKAGKSERLAALNVALTQIKERKHNKVCFWCGTPNYWLRGNRIISNLQTFLGNSPTTFLPYAERSILVLGAPGSGKTYGTINPIAESCLSQGFPMIFYARKEEEMEYFAPLAAMYGYEVKIFAPGELYSEVINPLDFMQDADDAETAGQIAEVILGNAKSGGAARDSDFFDKAAKLLAKALIQLAKSSNYPDLATVAAFMAVPDFIKKLDAAVQSGRIPHWIAASFQQYLKSKDSEKTVASIDTTTVAVFSSFIQKNILASFIGKTTIDLKLEGRKIIIFKLDDERRDVVGPLIAASMHLTIVRNLSTLRKDPIGIIVDEFPSIKFKDSPRWLNEYRSNGACFVLGVQSLEQLSDAYGEKPARAIISACSTKVLYNPANISTAEEFSKMYGNKDILIKNRSIANVKDGQNVTWSESLQTMAILTPDEIMRFAQGHCVITNPAYGSGGEGSVPMMLKIPIPKEDIKRQKLCKELWQNSVKERLIARVPPKDVAHLEKALNLRASEAARVLEEKKLDAQDSPPSDLRKQEEEVVLVTP
jgi:type IV secretory pathway TraG/TraD family ATPase VirD4